MSVEHLTTFHFRENSQLKAYIAEDSTSVVALSGPGQVCVVLSRVTVFFYSTKDVIYMQYYLTVCDWRMNDLIP